jgi:hypothetical protein
MYDWLLFLHVLAAFLLGVTVVMYSAVALGSALGGRATFVADRCWDVGGLGTLILGIWLALHLDEYEIWDGWILAAIGVWLIATGLGETVRKRLAEGQTDAVNAMHWLRTLAVIALLVLMIWKPGA